MEIGVSLYLAKATSWLHRLSLLTRLGSSKRAGLGRPQESKTKKMNPDLRPARNDAEVDYIGLKLHSFAIRNNQTLFLPNF